jgi:hypothetical protein
LDVKLRHYIMAAWSEIVAVVRPVRRRLRQNYGGRGFHSSTPQLYLSRFGH